MRAFRFLVLQRWRSHAPSTECRLVHDGRYTTFARFRPVAFARQIFRHLCPLLLTGYWIFLAACKLRRRSAFRIRSYRKLWVLPSKDSSSSSPSSEQGTRRAGYAQGTCRVRLQPRTLKASTMLNGRMKGMRPHDHQFRAVSAGKTSVRIRSLLFAGVRSPSRSRRLVLRDGITSM